MTEEELAEKIKAKVEEINKLLLEAHSMRLEVKISEDEQPALRISLSKTMRY
jgi:hypothetical protein